MRSNPRAATRLSCTRSALAIGLAVLAMMLGATPARVGGQGQPAPILLVVNATAPNPYGAYLAEVLRAEGIQSFTTVALSSLDAATLGGAKLALLAETALTSPQVTLFTNYVNGGGHLVAMKPDSQLAGLLGINVLGQTTSNGYVLVDQSGPGAGLQAATLPFKGVAANYALAGATEVAGLYSTRTQDTGLPAVVKFGRTAAWSFDLARSTAYTRQGDPAFAGQERDGVTPIRTTDIFFGNIDLQRMGVPHADVQMRLFSRVIADLLSDTQPLPRLWYFPGTARTIVLPTADSHTTTASSYTALVSSAEAKGARVSFYLSRFLTLPPAAATWRANGHELGLHPFMTPDGADFPTGYQNAQNWFAGTGLAPASPTVRHHLVEWSGWTTPLATLVANNMRMDASYYAWGPATYNPNQASQAHGYITGSGLPMRFVSTSGSVFPVYQQVTSLVDEQLVVGDYAELLSSSAALNVSHQLIDDSQAGGYSAIMGQFHVDFYTFGDVQPWVDGTLAYAQSLGIPMWTAERWLKFTEARAATAITNVTWSPGASALSFTATVPSGAEAQTMLVPATFGGSAITSVVVDGASASTSALVVNGQTLRAFSIAASGGAAHSVNVLYAVSTPSLSIGDVSVNEGDTGSTTANVTVSLSSPTSNTVTAHFQTADGTAVAGADYTAASGSVTFAPFQTSQTVPIAVLGDATVESAETFSVVLSSPTNATISDSVGIVTIVDNDALPTIDVNDVSVTEGNTGTTPATFVVSLSAARGYTVSVQYATAGGTATSGSDFTGGSGTVTFAPGVTSQNVVVPVIGDTLVEPDETFALNLSAPVNGVIGDGQGAGTIVNDDSAGGPTNATFQIASGADDVNEEGAAFYPDSSTVWVGSGATPATSFAGLRFSNVTIPVGATITSARLELQAASTQWLTIGFEFAMEASANSAPFSSGSLPSQRALLAPRVTHSSDQQWVAGTWYQLDDVAVILQAAINQPAWASGHALSFVMRGGSQPWARKFANSFETAAANAPRLLVTYTSPQGGASSLAISDVSVPEGNGGTSTATFTVTLTPASAQTVTVAYGTANGTATAGSDYTATSGTLTFAPGVTSQTVPVTVTGDTLNEANETFTVGLSAPTNATISDASGLGTITNDDAVPTLSIGDATVSEGNAGTKVAAFTVTLTPLSGQTVTVGYATANGTATAGSDYTATSGTLTFTPGTTTQTVSVTVTGDTVPEADETFTVGLSAPTNATITDGSGLGTITNDDAAQTLAINDVTQAEGNAGTTAAVFTVTLTPASAQTVTVAFATADGTATAGSDYTAASGTLTFAPGVTTQTIPVTVAGDTLNEANETFTVGLSAPTNAAISDNSGLGTITNDDAVPTLSINDVTVTEGNAGSTVATFTVTLSAASGQQVTVTYATANGTATAGSDYTSTTGTLTFAPGTITRTIPVTVAGDTLDEVNETFTVGLSSPTNASIADGSGLGTITDDDAAPALSVNDVTVNEGNAGTTNASFTVTLSAASGQTVTATYTTADGTATAGSDYTSVTGTVSFAPGVVSQTVPVPILGDTAIESNETFTLTLTSPVNATLADGQGLGTIANDDSGSVTITATFPVLAGADDVNEEGTSFTPDGSTVWVGSGATPATSFAGLRFANLTIPAGSTINSARLEVRAASTQWLTLSFEFAADAAANSAAFSTASRPSQRTLLAQRVAHSSNVQWVSGTAYQLDQIATVLQAAISQPGWTSGNAASLVLRGTGGAWARKFVSAFESGAANAPRLVVTYTTP